MSQGREKHAELVLHAIKWLRSMGIEAFSEYPVKIWDEEGMTSWYHIDVAGFTKLGVSIGIECGNVIKGRLCDTRGAFDLHMHWPYGAPRPHVVGNCQLCTLGREHDYCHSRAAIYQGTSRPLELLGILGDSD